MRIAVVSDTKQVGKTCIMELLGSVFARSQQRTVCLLSTSRLNSLFSYADVEKNSDKMRNPSVLKVLVEGGKLAGNDILNYAYRIGKEEVYAFDTYDSSMTAKDSNGLLLHLLGGVKTDLTIVEVTGKLDNPFNKEVLKNVDAVLYVFTQSYESIEGVKAYIETYKDTLYPRTCFVCNKYDEMVCGDKKLMALTGLKLMSLIVMPYNSTIMSYCLDGKLASLSKYIVSGFAEVINLRMKLLEMMQFFFDTGSHKYIKGVNEWNK